MRWLAYTWRVAVNLFYLAVVGAVLMGIQNPSEKATIAVLGLIYVAMRSQAIIQALHYSSALTAVSERLDQIYWRLDGSYEMPDYAEVRSAVERGHIKLYIDGTFLFLISLACFWAFFAAH